MTVALHLQDKGDTYGAITPAPSNAGLPPLTPEKARTTTTATSSSPFTRSPYNTTPKRKMLRKGSSVEFAAHHLEDEDLADEKQRRECRRLSFREKQELYKVRPDLEIGAPLAVQTLMEDQCDQRRRVASSMFAGIGCVMMLILFYYFIAWNMRDDPDFQ